MQFQSVFKFACGVITGLTASLLDFEPKSFSANLVPLPSAEDCEGGLAERTLSVRGNNTFRPFLRTGEQLQFSIQGGGIYGNRAPVKIRLFPALEPFGNSVADIEVPADKKWHPVVLPSSYEGLHRIEISDGNDLTAIRWPAGKLPLVIPSG